MTRINKCSESGGWTRSGNSVLPCRRESSDETGRWEATDWWKDRVFRRQFGPDCNGGIIISCARAALSVGGGKENRERSATLPLLGRWYRLLGGGE